MGVKDKIVTVESLKSSHDNLDSKISSLNQTIEALSTEVNTITLNSDNVNTNEITSTSSVKIGDGILTWDSVNNAIVFSV